LPLLYK